MRRVRDEVFGWLQRLSLRYHHGTVVGDVIFRAGTDTCAFQILFQEGLLIVVSATGTLLFMAVMMARLNLYLTAVALVAVPVLLASIKIFGGAMRSRGMAAQRAESKVYSLIHQGITALPLIQSHVREHHEQRRFTAHTEAARQHKMSQQGLEVFYWGSISVVLAACTLGVTWVGAQQVLAANLTLGELLVFLAYVAQLFEPLHQLSKVGATLSSASASTRRVFEILDTPEEVKDRPDARPVLRGLDVDGRLDCPPPPTTCSPPPALPRCCPVDRSRFTATSPTTTSPSTTIRRGRRSTTSASSSSRGRRPPSSGRAAPARRRC